MKKLILIGNLTKDVETTVTGGGKKLHKFSLAVNEKKGDQQIATFINCNYWREDEKLNQYLKKGAKVHIIGNLDIQNYTDKEGIKRNSVNCTVGEISILSFVKPVEGDTAPAQSNQSQENNFSASGADDDLPF